jgi:membrane protease YdiL (CAAX protease family)
MQEPERPSFRISIIAIVLFQVAALFPRSMLDLSLRRNGMEPAVANDLSYLVVPPILLVLMFPYLRRCSDSLRQLFAVRLLTLRVAASAVALGLTLRAMWWASTTFLIGIGVYRADEPNAIVGPILGFECPPLEILGLSLVITAAVIPITEEVVQRGFILHGALPYGRNTAIVGSAILFALMHVTDSYGATFLAGLVFAAQALNYRALWGPIIAHAAYNAAAVIDWDCFRIVWNPPESDLAFVYLTWASVPLMLAGTWVVTLLIREKAAGTLPAPRPKQVRG